MPHLTLQYLLEIHLPLFARFLELGDLLTTLHLDRTNLSLGISNALRWNCRFSNVFVAPTRRTTSTGVWVQNQLRWYIHLERLLEQVSHTGSEDLVSECVYNLKLRLSEPRKPNRCTSLPQSQQQYNSWIRQISLSEKALLYLCSGSGPLSVTVRNKAHHYLPQTTTFRFFHRVSAAIPLLHMDCVAQAQLWKIAVLRRFNNQGCLCEYCISRIIRLTVHTYGQLRRGVLP